METQFAGLFDDAFDKKKLYNLVSEQWMMGITAYNILKIYEIEWKYLEEFEKKIVSNKDKAFFDPINKKQETKICNFWKERIVKKWC